MIDRQFVADMAAGEALSTIAKRDKARAQAWKGLLARLDAPAVPPVVDPPPPVDPPPVDPPPVVTPPPVAGSYGHVTPLAQLTASGSVTITAGGVIEKVHVTGSITIKADGVVFRDGRLTYNSPYGLFVDPSVKVPPVFEDFTFVGGGMASSCVHRPYEPVTFRRCDVSNSCDGIKARSGTQILDSYIHGLYVGNDANGNWVHSDGIQIEGGTGIRITGNRIVLTATKASNTGDNACIMASTDFEDIDDVVIDGNDFFGGQYCVQIVQKGSRVLGQNVKLTNNAFHRDGYVFGPYRTDPQVASTGNHFDDGTPA